MIDFEVVGDLLRKAKIPHKVMIKDKPMIVADAPIDDGCGDIVEFVFDRTGNLECLRVR